MSDRLVAYPGMHPIPTELLRAIHKPLGLWEVESAVEEWEKWQYKTAMNFFFRKSDPGLIF